MTEIRSYFEKIKQEMRKQSEVAKKDKKGNQKPNASSSDVNIDTKCSKVEKDTKSDTNGKKSERTLKIPQKMGKKVKGHV